jgi:hypothetical protein
MSSKVLVRDADGVIVNRIAWNEGDPLVAPAGHHFEDDLGYEMGGTLISGVYTAPAPIPPTPEQLRTTEVMASTLRQEYVDLLKGPFADIEPFVRSRINADGVTNLATAITFAKRTETAVVRIAQALALIVRQ